LPSFTANNAHRRAVRGFRSLISPVAGEGVICGVRKQRQVPGTLDGDRQAALMAGAGARLAARLDLPALCDVAAQL
jgi:hypothetical protein